MAILLVCFGDFIPFLLFGKCARFFGNTAVEICIQPKSNNNSYIMMDQ